MQYKLARLTVRIGDRLFPKVRKAGRQGSNQEDREYDTRPVHGSLPMLSSRPELFWS
jgi:hypothetical protein